MTRHASKLLAGIVAPSAAAAHAETDWFGFGDGQNGPATIGAADTVVDVCATLAADVAAGDRGRFAACAVKWDVLDYGTMRVGCRSERWREDGGQAILTLRSPAQSGRWQRGWALMAAHYVHAVTLPDNVIPLRRAS